MAESKQFEILDLIPGEAAFRAYGKNSSELFENGARALFSIMVELSGVRPREERPISLSNQKLEGLYIDFLSELVFLKDAEAMLFSEYEIKVEVGEPCRVSGSVKGEHIDSERHKLGVDVKAVTLHLYKLEKSSEGYRAQVVLDI